MADTPDQRKPTMIIAVDFDGTIVDHDYPRIGAPNPLAIECMASWQKQGCRLILWTMRSGPTLDDAVGYLRENGILLWGVNQNPGQADWSQSPKAYAQLYVDDAALGAPLFHPPGFKRPAVDWRFVAPRVQDMLDSIQRQARLANG